MEVAPLLLVTLLNTEYCESVAIVVQFVALKVTVVIAGQFQKAYPPMLSIPVPMVKEGIATQP